MYFDVLFQWWQEVFAILMINVMLSLFTLYKLSSVSLSTSYQQGTNRSCLSCNVLKLYHVLLEARLEMSF